MPRAATKSTIIAQPFLGLMLDKPTWQADPRAFTACNNVRIYRGKVTNSLMGWQQFYTQVVDGPVTLVTQIQFLIGFSIPIIGTGKSLYQVQNNVFTYLNPQYNEGIILVNNGSPNIVGTGTRWNTSIGGGFRNNIQPGDMIFVGATGQTAVNATWYVVQTVTDDTHITLTTPVVANNPGTTPYTGHQTFTGDNQTYTWSAEIFPGAGAPWNTDMIFITNGADPLFAWNGTSSYGQFVPTMPFLAFKLRRFNNLMIYGNLVQGGTSLPTSIANSDNGLPTVMAGGVAGQYVVSDGAHPLNYIGTLGNLLMLYMGDPNGGDVIGAQFVGAPNFFAFTPIIRGRGPIAGRLVAEFPDRHQFITTDGEYRYNGLFVQVMNTQLWRAVLPNFDASRAGLAHAVINQELGDLIWALPLNTDTNKPSLQTAYVEHYLEQAQSLLFKPFTQRDWPFSCVGLIFNSTFTTWNQLPNGWNTYTQRWNQFFSLMGSYPAVVTGDNNGDIWQLYANDTQNNAAINAFCTFSERITIDQHSRGLVKRVYPFADTNTTVLTVNLSMFDQLGGAVTISDTQTINLLYPGNRFTTHYRRGRAFQVTFSTNAMNAPWFLGGYDADIVPGGQR